jgi:hypothetical protein
MMADESDRPDGRRLPGNPSAAIRRALAHAAVFRPGSGTRCQQLASVSGRARRFVHQCTALPDTDFTLTLSVAYFAAASVLAIASIYLRRHFRAQLAMQLATDLVLITLLVVLAGGLRGGIMVLYLLPLAGAALLLPTSAAFFVCSLAVLALLADSVWRSMLGQSSDSSLFQTGLVRRGAVRGDRVVAAAVGAAGHPGTAGIGARSRPRESTGDQSTRHWPDGAGSARRRCRDEGAGQQSRRPPDARPAAQRAVDGPATAGVRGGTPAGAGVPALARGGACHGSLVQHGDAADGQRAAASDAGTAVAGTLCASAGRDK